MSASEPAPRDPPAYPGVSVIMPVRNEARHLAESVGSVLAQDYPGPVQVVLCVGPSTDDTSGAAHRLAAADGRVLVLDNPQGRTPVALNLALRRAEHGIVARVDGHGALPADYLRVAVRVLHETGAANVGGIALPQGQTPMQQAIAVAMGSRLGMGGAPFRVGGLAGEAQTVFPGVFRREWIEAVGGFDDSYARAQDWELNLRIREAGGVIWFTPELTVHYRPRGTLAALGRQFFETGQWRRRLAAQHHGALGLRYLAPPVALLAVAGGAVGAWVWRPLAALPLGYAVSATVGGVLIARDQPWAVRLRVPGALATMHLGWGAGFLRGLSARR